MDSAPPYLLLVEDNPGDARLTRELAQDGGVSEPLLWVQSLDEALQTLSTRPGCHAVLLDLGLPDAQGLEALQTLRRQQPECPLLVLTGQDDDRTGLAAVVAGAQDYLVKGSFDAGSLRRSIAFARQRVQVERALVRRALHDDLTDLPRRTLFLDRLDGALSQCRRRRGQGALLFVDIDHFKRTNDNYGHAAGDAVLRAVAERSASCLRESDCAARLGGDEFVVLLGEVASPAEALDVGHKLHEALARPLSLAGQDVPVSVSIGVALFGSTPESADQVMARADAAMYAAKAAGRGQVCVLTECSARPVGPAA